MATPPAFVDQEIRMQLRMQHQDAASKDSMEQNIDLVQITYIKEHTDAKKILLLGANIGRD